MLDASNWNKNPADFRQSDILPLTYRCLSVSKKNIYVYIYIYAYWLPKYSIYEKSFAFTRMWQSSKLHLNAKPPVYIYIYVYVCVCGPGDEVQSQVESYQRLKSGTWCRPA